MPNDDYILRSDVLQIECDLCIATHCKRDHQCIKAIRLNNLPAADVEPVRPGRWVSKEGIYGVVYCSICDFELKIDNTPRCPNCGAKMDAEPPKEDKNGEDISKCP